MISSRRILGLSIATAWSAAWGFGCSAGDDMQGASAIAAGGNASNTVGAGGTAGVAGNVAGPAGGVTASAGDAAGSTAAGGVTGPRGVANTACTISSELTMSQAIATVGIVEFTTDLQGMDQAFIEFGLDDGYGLTAPVDLQEPGYRTLLLGMKPSSEYHYRVVAMAGDRRCDGEDGLLRTGPRPNALYSVTLDTPQPAKLNGGYSLSGFFVGGTAFILDADGDYVWWYTPPAAPAAGGGLFGGGPNGADLTRVRMSYDGKFMWMRNGNVGGGASRIHRVSMDGMSVKTFDGSTEFGDGHHDFTVLPDGTMLLIQHDAATGCDKIVERSPDGTVRDVVNAMEAHGSRQCHVNSLHYYAPDDTITFSDLTQNCYVKTTRDGQVLWVAGGPASTFTSGDGLQWSRQHGHHVLGPNRMLMFENGGFGFGMAPGAGASPSATAHEIVLDPEAGTVDRVWEYQGGGSSFVLGDVQRLPNGNTLVTYSTDGTVHEVDPEGNLVQSIVWGIGGAVGYMQRRMSLYGPPPNI